MNRGQLLLTSTEDQNLQLQLDALKKRSAKGVNFKSITDMIDTTASAGRFFFHIMASLSQIERELILQRTKAGLAVARSLGRVGGRKRIMTDGKIKSARKLLAAGHTPKDVARDLGIPVATLYRWIPSAASIV